MIFVNQVHFTCRLTDSGIKAINTIADLQEARHEASDIEKVHLSTKIAVLEMGQWCRWKRQQKFFEDKGLKDAHDKSWRNLLNELPPLQPYVLRCPEGRKLVRQDHLNEEQVCRMVERAMAKGFTLHTLVKIYRSTDVAHRRDTEPYPVPVCRW
jgi:hypothetical protein